MERFFVTLVLLISFVVLLGLSASDVSSRRLPNVWVGSHALLFIAFAFCIDLGWSPVGWHIFSGLSALIVGAGLFALRWLGGGDVKLWAAVMLWAGPNLWLQALIIGTLAGAGVALLSLLAAKLTRLPQVPGQRFWRLLSADRGVPYGVGLSLAGIYVLYVYLQTVLRLHYAA